MPGLSPGHTALTDSHVCAFNLQLGNLLGLKPIDLSAASLPAVGVPPLDVSDLLGVQFLGFSIANFSVPDARLSVSSSEQTVLIRPGLADANTSSTRLAHCLTAAFLSQP